MENTESLKKAQVSLPHCSFRDTPLNSKGRRHMSSYMALYKDKEGMRDLQLLSLNSLISRSNGSLKIKNGNQEMVNLPANDSNSAW